MTLRFLELTESDVPGFPFRPGQIIRLASLSSRQRAWLQSGHAELVAEEPESYAVVAAPSKAVKRAGKL